MRRNKKLILISSILATTAIAVVPAISIVNNINTVNVIDSQLDNVVQNNEQVEVDGINSDISTIEDNSQAKADSETFIIDATTLEGTWGTGLSGNLVFTISDGTQNVSVKAEVTTSFTAIDFSIQETITNAGEEYRITEIDTQAFDGCVGLTGTLTIPSSVTTISDRAFYNCRGLTGTLTIPSSVTSISHWAFYNCKGITGALTIPASVTSIGASAFRFCSGLASLDLTNATSLKTIGREAFSSCTSLTNLTIPANVTSIGVEAFSGCKFTSIKIDSGNQTFVLADNLGKNCYGVIKKGVQTGFDFAKNAADQIIGGLLCGQLELPSGLTSIAENAFKSCSGLTGALTIPASVTSIGNYAFYECSGLTGALTIPASVTSIGNRAFDSCYKLSGTLTIPASVTFIGEFAFASCTDMTSAVIGGGVTSIGDKAFWGCPKLADVTIFATTPPAIQANSFMYSTQTLYVPAGCEGAYKNDANWGKFKNVVTIGSIALSGSQGDNKIITGTGGNIVITAAIGGAVTGNLTWSIEDDSSQPGELPNGITIKNETNSGCEVSVDPTVVAATYNVILTADGEVDGKSATSDPFKLTIIVDSIPTPPGSITLSGSQGDNKIITGTGGNIVITATIDGTLTPSSVKWKIDNDPDASTDKLDGITLTDETDSGCKVNVDPTVVAGVYNAILTATGTVNGASISSEPFKLTIIVDSIPTPPGSIALSGSQSGEIITGTGGNIAITATIDGTLTPGSVKWEIDNDPDASTDKSDGITLTDKTDSGCKVNVDPTVVAGVYNAILTATGTVNGASISSEPFKLTITVTAAPIPPEPKPVPADDLNLAAIIGGSVGGAVGVAAIAGGITYGVKHSKKIKK